MRIKVLGACCTLVACLTMQAQTTFQQKVDRAVGQEPLRSAVVGVMVLVLALLVLYALHFVYSDEHDQIFREYYERNVSQEE